jgi:hypothetical protein
MKNLIRNHISTPLVNRFHEYKYRNSFNRSANKPKISTKFIRPIRSNWQNMVALV